MTSCGPGPTLCGKQISHTGCRSQASMAMLFRSCQQQLAQPAIHMFFIDLGGRNVIWATEVIACYIQHNLTCGKNSAYQQAVQWKHPSSLQMRYSQFLLLGCVARLRSQHGHIGEIKCIIYMRMKKQCNVQKYNTILNNIINTI